MLFACMIDVEEGIKVLDLGLECLLVINSLHAPIAMLFETATFINGELPGFKATHGIIASDQPIVVQLLLLLLTRLLLRLLNQLNQSSHQSNTNRAPNRTTCSKN